MITIKEDIEEVIIINKSKFIGILKYVDNIDDVNNYLLDIKKKYPGATHYCYSYIIDNVKRFNDDGEPGGTAGMPILNVIEQNNLNHVLLVVVRYFGGIKLGAGGLVRAYSKISVECIKNCSKALLVDAYVVDLMFNYDEIKFVDNIIKDIKVINKEFNESIVYRVIIPKDDYSILNSINNKIINEIQIRSDI